MFLNGFMQRATTGKWIYFLPPVFFFFLQKKMHARFDVINEICSFCVFAHYDFLSYSEQGAEGKKRNWFLR